MLTIKKRYPWRNAIMYGSGAFIVGFAGAMTLLVQSNLNENRFAYIEPRPEVNQERPKEEPAPTTSNEESQPQSNDTSWTIAPSRPSGSSGTAPAPVQTQQNPQPTAPSEPASPATPEIQIPPVSQPNPEPEPEEPTVIEEIVEVITP